MKIKKNNRGFSLAEMLVAVGIFTIAILVSSSVFINVNSLQQQTANMAKLQNEGRYLMEKMGKEIRGRELDYGQTILSSAGLADALVFKPDEYGETYKLFFDSVSQSIKIETKNSDTVARDAALSKDEIIVENLFFKVAPLVDPYSVLESVNPPLEQPRVTIVMTIKNRGVIERFQKTLHLQTTVSSKIYH